MGGLGRAEQPFPVSQASQPKCGVDGDARRHVDCCGCARATDYSIGKGHGTAEGHNHHRTSIGVWWFCERWDSTNNGDITSLTSHRSSAGNIRCQTQRSLDLLRLRRNERNLLLDHESTTFEANPRQYRGFAKIAQHCRSCHLNGMSVETRSNGFQKLRTIPDINGLRPSHASLVMMSQDG